MPHKAGVSDNMIANNLTSFIPTHPGDVIKDEIEYRGITQRQLSVERNFYVNEPRIRH